MPSAFTECFFFCVSDHPSAQGCPRKIYIFLSENIKILCTRRRLILYSSRKDKTRAWFYFYDELCYFFISWCVGAFEGQCSGFLFVQKTQGDLLGNNFGRTKVEGNILKRANRM